MIEVKSPTARRLDPLDSLLGYNLRRLSVITMDDLTKALAPLGLKPVAATVLFVVGSNVGLTQSDVGKALGILRANMAPMVATLMRRGLLERERLDGRSHALRLSAKGRTVFRDAWQLVRAHEDRLFGTLSPSARARMTAQLQALWKTRESERSAASRLDH